MRKSRTRLPSFLEDVAFRLSCFVSLYQTLNLCERLQRLQEYTDVTINHEKCSASATYSMHIGGGPVGSFWWGL